MKYYELGHLSNEEKSKLEASGLHVYDLRDTGGQDYQIEKHVWSNNMGCFISSEILDLNECEHSPYLDINEYWEKYPEAEEFDYSEIKKVLEADSIEISDEEKKTEIMYYSSIVNNYIAPCIVDGGIIEYYYNGEHYEGILDDDIFTDYKEYLTYTTTKLLKDIEDLYHIAEAIAWLMELEKQVTNDNIKDYLIEYGYNELESEEK